ncbi:MAG TPA: MCP four helix bundle domain-containing protein, partial [Pseudomonas sp.]|nr:MCP four helix bundle domain-containing protein [Pseudomonas sp.]
MNLTNLKLVQRLSLCFAVLVALLALLLGLGLKQISDLRGSVDELTNHSFPKTVWANDVIDQDNAIARSVRTLLIARNDAQMVSEQKRLIDDAGEIAEERLGKLDRAISSDEGRRMLQALQASHSSFRDILKNYLDLFDAGQFDQAQSYLQKDLRDIQNLNLKNVTALITFQSQLVSQLGHQTEEDASGTIRLLLIIGGLAVVLACVLGFLLIRSVNRQLGADPQDLAHITGRIAEGDFALDLPDAPPGSAMAAVKHMLGSLRQSAAAASANARIKTALDNVTSNVMIADNERNIIYMNKTVVAMLQNAEADLRKGLPGFDVNKLDGGSIDQFHKNPEHQKRLLATFTSTYRAQIEVGG